MKRKVFSLLLLINKHSFVTVSQNYSIMGTRSTLIASSIWCLIVGLVALVGGSVCVGLDPTNAQFLLLQGNIIKTTFSDWY